MHVVNVYSGQRHAIDFVHLWKCMVINVDILCSSGVPEDGLYFTLKGTVYLHNETVFIQDIGPNVANRSDRGAALVCHTDNVNTECCRDSDNINGNGPIGDWFYPNNSQVLHNGDATSYTNIFVRIVYEREVRLVMLGSPTGPLGLYTCRVPSRDENVSASIYIMSGKLTMCQ